MEKNRNYNRKIRWFAQGLLCKTSNVTIPAIGQVGLNLGPYNLNLGSNSWQVLDTGFVNNTGSTITANYVATGSQNTGSYYGFFTFRANNSTNPLGNDGYNLTSQYASPQVPTSGSFDVRGLANGEPLYIAFQGGNWGTKYTDVNFELSWTANIDIGKSTAESKPRELVNLGEYASITTLGNHTDGEWIDHGIGLSLEFVEKYSGNSGSEKYVGVPAYSYITYQIAVANDNIIMYGRYSGAPTVYKKNIYADFICADQGTTITTTNTNIDIDVYIYKLNLPS